MKWIVCLIIAISLVLSFVCIYFFIEDTGLKKNFNEFCGKKEKELKLQLGEIKDKVREDFNEKYKESSASFEKLAGNLKEEREKVKALKEEILRMKK